MLTCIFRRLAVSRFEDSVFITKIRAGREAEAADEAGAQIAHDVAEHILGHEDRVILRVLEHPHADRVFSLEFRP